MRFARVDGVLVEPLGEVWAAFSPASGETILLNDESAAILEILLGGPGDRSSVSAALAEDSGMPADELAPMVDAHWRQLVEAGLVRRHAMAGVGPA